MSLQKKWRNIRDSFVKAHKAKETKSGSAAKKKIPYVFYDNLLFLKDTVAVNSTACNVNEINEEVAEDGQNNAAQSSDISWAPKRNKKRKNDDDVGKELIGVLNRNLEKKNLEDDEDRLFFLSLVKEFNKIPDHLRIQTKLDILKVIKDAQFPYHINTYPVHNTGYYPRNNPSTTQPHEVGAFASGTSVPIHSPPSVDSTGSQESQDTQHFIELFNCVQNNDSM